MDWIHHVSIEADDPMGHLILFSPEDQPFFALEPVTNANNGFNLLADGQSDSGVVELQPGETLSTGFRLTFRAER